MKFWQNEIFSWVDTIIIKNRVFVNYSNCLTVEKLNAEIKSFFSGPDPINFLKIEL